MSSRKPKLSVTKRKVKAPTAKASRKAAPVSKAKRAYVTKDPAFKQGMNSIEVRHREFVTDVTGQTAFTPLSFPINPGRDTLFTWLSDLAARYERYQFSRLSFHYEPRCSTATAGTVILAVDYDPLDAAPANKQDVYAYHHSAQSSAWDECVLPVDPMILRNRGTLFTRPGAAPSGADLKTYDLGNLWLCVSGFSGPVVSGELFVEYSICLSIPQMESNVQDASYISTTSDRTFIFGTSPLALTGLLDATVTGTTITFQQNWNGQVDLYVTGTGATTITLTGTATVVSGSAVVDGTTTHAQKLFFLTALRGQTLVVDVTAWTTVTGCSWYFAPK